MTNILKKIKLRIIWRKQKPFLKIGECELKTLPADLFEEEPNWVPRSPFPKWSVEDHIVEDNEMVQ